MRLKEIARVSFNRSEQTNYEHLSGRLKLDKDEVLVLVSLTGDQICFVYKPTHANSTMGQVVHSERIRLSKKRKWSPLMLANYARDVGMQLDGLKLFEHYYEKKWTQQK